MLVSDLAHLLLVWDWREGEGCSSLGILNDSPGLPQRRNRAKR